MSAALFLAGIALGAGWGYQFGYFTAYRRATEQTEEVVRHARQQMERLNKNWERAYRKATKPKAEPRPIRIDQADGSFREYGGSA